MNKTRIKRPHINIIDYLAVAAPKVVATITDVMENSGAWVTINMTTRKIKHDSNYLL
ncbi:MAG: hypothetical protein OQK46_00830 [Gammaproteobacteria bacterium]|nr:hypothetical protein [Gammaproteobacteria bacterium]